MDRFRLTTHQLKLTAGIGVGVLALWFGAFWLTYAGRILPGVYANGVNVGGMSKQQAKEAIARQAEAYAGQQIPVNYNNAILTIPIGSLSVNYTDDAVDAALNYGQNTRLTTLIWRHLRSMFSRPTYVHGLTFDDAKMTGFLSQIDEAVEAPVANAQLGFEEGNVNVSSSTPGKRLDRGLLVSAIEDRLANMSNDPVEAPIYDMTPSINESALANAKDKAATYVQSPLTLAINGDEQTVPQDKILTWIGVDTEAAPTDMSTDPLQTFYPPPAQQNVSLAVNQKAVAAYVAGLAQQVDRAPTDAQLAFTDGKVQVSKPAQTGVQLNQQRAIEQIANALQNGSSGRSLTLQTSVKQADVREDNLAALGINERISEGVTYFPGSTSSRLVNVRVGQAKYNGVLLKPGQTFSFGEILGDVGPAQGYVPELVILGNHEEKQYGGGLCQVASTAFRAALLAGLPIAERYNHSFAVGYYTAPFGVPGVDATIYYPQVDFKFVNDTGHYILIQTHMEGTTLTFDYYGTKTKTGEIRGPQFITGTNDAKQASHTVFYEDIKDLSGNVTKSVRFDSYYQPSTNFPIEQQKTGA